MKRLYVWGMVLWAIGWQLSALSPEAQAGETAKQVVTRYVQALIDEQWDAAESCWAPSAITASKRLGIEYTGVPAKYDFESLVVRSLDSIRGGNWRYIVDSEKRRIDWRQVNVILKRGKEKSKETYVLGRVEGEWRIFPELDLLTRDWPVWTTRYVRLHCEDPKRVDEIMLSYLDEFVDSTCAMLQIAQDRREFLAQEKIEYYVLSPEELQQLLGWNIAGAALRSSNSVVSGRFTHSHELAHVIVEFAAGKSPAWTPQFLKEGAAVALGGRWGLSPNVAMQYSELVASQDQSMLNRTLPSEDPDEEAGTFWLSYWAGAIFVDCLLQSLGPDSFLDLYRRLSAPSQTQLVRNRVAVMDSVADILGMTYDQFIDNCRSKSERYSYSGIRPTLRQPERSPDAEGSTESFSVRVWETDSVYLFEVRAGEKRPYGALLFKCKMDSGVTQLWSALFEAQFYGRDYQGECLGLRFSASEVGLFNYQLDRLEALFTSRLSPNNPPIWDAVTQCLRFTVERELLPGDVAQTVSQMGKPVEIE